MTINNVAILGGNGTVGSLVGGIITSFGKANTYLVVRDKQKKVEELCGKVYKSVRTDEIKDRLKIIDYTDAREILKECDWIFESVAENYDIKEDVFEFVNKYASDDAIITTGTSGLSINELSKKLDKNRRKRFFGTHFFNPPYNMNLCELISCDDTDKECLKEFKSYLENVLIRNVIESKDNPAFIANRIGFKFLNDLLVYSEEVKEKGGVDYIDYLFDGYTGRGMRPLVTINFVGLDIHKAIVDNIYNNTNDIYTSSFIIPGYVHKLIENGFMGKKSGCGLYKKIENSTSMCVYDIEKEEYREIVKYTHEEKENIVKMIENGDYTKAYKMLVDSNNEELKFVVKMLVNYIVYSYIIGKESAMDIKQCDDAMSSGFGWCPPFALKDLMEEVTDFSDLCKKYVDVEILNKYDIINGMKYVEKSSYDYRKYIKAI